MCISGLPKPAVWFLLASFMLLANPAESDSFRISQPYLPDSSDPVYTFTGPAFTVFGGIYEPLVLVGRDGQIQPGQAKSWTISNDSTVYEFKLRADAKWSDGAKVTASQFEHAFKRHFDPQLSFSHKATYMLAPIKNAVSIKKGHISRDNLAVDAINDDTLVFRLEEPTSYFLYMLAYPGLVPVPTHFMKGDESGWWKGGEHPTNGPYQIVSWEAEKIELTRNIHHWDTVEAQHVAYVRIDNEDQLLLEFLNGRLDIASYLLQEERSWASPGPEVRIESFTKDATAYLAFNTQNPKLQDAEVRRAISLVIDREFISRGMGFGKEQAARSFSSPANWTPPPDTESDSLRLPWEERRDFARQTLLKMGYSAANPLELEVAHFEPLGNLKAAYAIHSMLSSIDVIATVKTIHTRGEWDEYTTQGQHELVTEVWNADFRDPISYSGQLDGEAPSNLAHYHNPEYQSMLRAAEREASTVKRYQIYEEIERLIARDRPILPIFHTTIHYGFSERVANVAPTGIIHLRNLELRDNE